MVGIIANVRNPNEGLVSCEEVRCGEGVSGKVRREGSVIGVRITNRDGRAFEVRELLPLPGRPTGWPLRKRGSLDFQWAEFTLSRSERKNRFWDDYMMRPPDGTPFWRHRSLC